MSTLLKDFLYGIKEQLQRGQPLLTIHYDPSG